jgi:RNA polymerase sigma-70 factor (ECF subfamily)
MQQFQKSTILQALPQADSELVKKAQKGNTRAFEELIQRYEQKVYNIAYRMLGNPEEAKDAMQDSFLRSYRFINKFKGESTFYTWLYRITTNVCLTRLKQRQKKESLTLSLDEPIADAEDTQREIPDFKYSPELLHERQAMQKALQSAINELPSEYRSVIVLRELQGLSNKEVSKALRLTVASVKSRLHRGRVFLRNRLSKYIENKNIISEKDKN